MPKTPTQLRLMAQQVRAEAAHEPDPRIRSIMLKIAEAYDEIARRREKRGNGDVG